MEIKNLEAFIALANSLNFTKSAEQLYVSQPTFSRQITRLEDEFGCTLFKRNKRSVELTETGYQFLEYAERIVAEYNRWKACIDETKRKDTGHLRIGFLNDLPDKTFPCIVSAFREQHPQIKMSYFDRNISELMDGLLREDLDISFTFSYNMQNLHDINNLLVTSYPLCIVVSKDHRFAERDSVYLSECAADPFIELSKDLYNISSKHVDSVIKQAGFTLRPVATLSSVTSVFAMVAANAGVGILGKVAENIAPNNLRFIPLADNNSLTETALLWKRKDRNPAVKMFIETARAVIAEVNAPAKPLEAVSGNA